MQVDFNKTELLYLDILATEKLDIIKHRHERDKRIFDTLDIDIHERIVLYESQIKAFTDIHNKIVSAVGSLSLDPTVSVSYTHLDVYKRQQIYFRQFFGGLFTWSMPVLCF